LNSRLTALTARRAALQAEVALQRDDARQAYAEIERSAARVDRAVATVRRLTPVLAVVGAIGLLALGPARAVSLLRRVVTLGVFANQARRLLR
jgi:hypothetical protein